jgi:protein dithiol oxidoreductase (disulfide-forming)
MFLRTRAARTVCLLAASALVASVAFGAPVSQPVEGKDYRTLATPQPTNSPGKIEVLEFFSYGCPHCNEFYPLLTAWLTKLPRDVVFHREAVSFGHPLWVNLARAFYALQATGDLPKLDAALFHALHEEQLPLIDEPSLADWVGKNGGNADKFAAAYTSFGVNNHSVQADAMAEAYTIDGIPALVIDGRYLALGNTHEEMLANADKLIAMVRGNAKPAATGALSPR